MKCRSSPGRTRLHRLVTSLPAGPSHSIQKDDIARYVLTKEDGKYRCDLVGDSPIENYPELSRWSDSSDSSTTESDTDDPGKEIISHALRRRIRQSGQTKKESQEATRQYFLKSKEERLNAIRKFFSDRPSLTRCLDTEGESSTFMQGPLLERLFDEVQRQSRLDSRGELDAYVFWKEVREQLRVEDGDTEELDEKLDENLDQQHHHLYVGNKSIAELPHVPKRKFGDPTYLQDVRKLLMKKLVESKSQTSLEQGALKQPR